MTSRKDRASGTDRIQKIFAHHLAQWGKENISRNVVARRIAEEIWYDLVDEIRRADMADVKAPLFSQPPYHADDHGSYIWGKDIFDGQCMTLQCRGWGYLTGGGKALKLDGDEAIRRQKAMMDFVAAAMNEKAKRDFPTPPQEN